MGPAMTGAPILSNLGVFLSRPADFLTLILERISQTRAMHTNWMKMKIKFGCLRHNIDNTDVARKFIHGQG